MYASSVWCFLVFTCRLCMYPHAPGPVIYPISIKHQARPALSLRKWHPPSGPVSFTPSATRTRTNTNPNGTKAIAVVELELKLTQTYMTQKPLLWVEVGAYAVRKRSECAGVVLAGAVVTVVVLLILYAHNLSLFF